MKALLALALIVLILGASFSPQVSATLSPASASLPAAQRTAVYAPVVATKSAGDSLTHNANASAAAQEQEAARVYAQAQADEQAKRVAVATQQAAFATQTANDIAVSKEFATLSAVSIQATSEAISRTIAYDAEQYHANVAAIQATSEAAQMQAQDVADKSNATKTVDTIWQYFPTLAALILFALLILTLWKLIGRITPRIEEVEIEVPTPLMEPAIPPRPMQPPDLAKIAANRAAYNMALRYVEDSIRQNGGKSSRMITATEWEANGSNRDNHTIALSYLKDNGMIRTQQGGKPEDQGTFVQEQGKDLVYLLRLLSTTPPP